MTDAPCALLRWDSDYWGVPIARVEGNRMTEARLVQVDDWCRANGIACVFFLAAVDDPETSVTAERGGFFYTDMRLTLQAQFARRRELDATPRVRPFEPRDLDLLREVARVSHRITRFYHDPNFSDERCDELYADWLTADCESSSHAVFVAELDGQAAGYISCAVDADKIGRVGLLGVSPDRRSKGLGGELVSAAFQSFVDGGAVESIVFTQAHNIPAVRLFTRGGYLAEKAELWFHKWYDR
ncbi:MAG: GNAT family N-acetyltransferase [Gaiellaceae bacterium]